MASIGAYIEKNSALFLTATFYSVFDIFISFVYHLVNKITRQNLLLQISFLRKY